MQTVLNDTVYTKEDIHMAMEIISKESLRLSELVNNLLDFSRFEANAVTLYLREICLNDLIYSVLNQLSVMVNNANIRHFERI